MNSSLFHPILSCEESVRYERDYFKGDLDKAMDAMNQAGVALGNLLLRELSNSIHDDANVLLVLGKGHNSGDAIIAVKHIKQRHPSLQIDILFLLGKEGLSPSIKPLLESLMTMDRVCQIDVEAFNVGRRHYDLSIDGVFGMQCRLPVSDQLINTFEAINHADIDIRVSVDLPSGLTDSGGDHCIRADYTIATGIMKSPLIDHAHISKCGRIRYLDIGFFEDECEIDCQNYVFSPLLLSSISKIRSVCTDKRSYGHLFIIAGSKKMPGAMMMAVRSALKSGVGLVTVIAPESVCPSASVLLPEAMWIPCQESDCGELFKLEQATLDMIKSRATGLLIGPGLGKSDTVQLLVDHVLSETQCPVLLDADALIRDRFMSLVASERISVFTPHRGEFMRIFGQNSVDEFCADETVEFFRDCPNSVMVLKGAVTSIFQADRRYVSPYGNPVLARGGSGDLLAGLIAGKIANPLIKDSLQAVAGAVALHGQSADRLASTHGEHHVQTTQILDFL